VSWQSFLIGWQAGIATAGVLFAIVALIGIRASWRIAGGEKPKLGTLRPRLVWPDEEER